MYVMDCLVFFAEDLRSDRSFCFYLPVSRQYIPMSIYFPHHLRNSFSVGGITAKFVNGSLLTSSSFGSKARALLGMGIIIGFFFKGFRIFASRVFKNKSGLGGWGRGIWVLSVIKHQRTLDFFFLSFAFGNEDLLQQKGQMVLMIPTLFQINWIDLYDGKRGISQEQERTETLCNSYLYSTFFFLQKITKNSIFI